MKAFKITLLVVLVLVSAVYGFHAISQSLSGADVGPTISCPDTLLEISVHDGAQALLTDVTATDRQDGDLTSKVQVLNVSKFITDYTAKITYVVFDSDNNMATCTRQLRFADYVSPTFSITEPLIYGRNASVLLLDRLKVTDVIDGDITHAIRVSPIQETSDPEIFSLDIQVANSMGDAVAITLPIIMQESTLNRAEVELSSYLVYISRGSAFTARDYLQSVTTPMDNGSLSHVEITGNVDTYTPGTYLVYYRYRDQNCTGAAILTVVVQ